MTAYCTRKRCFERSFCRIGENAAHTSWSIRSIVASTNELAHFKWLDDRFAQTIPSTSAHTATELIHLLRKKGAGETVWAISDDIVIDGKEMLLDKAMAHIWGRQIDVCRG